MTDTDSLHGFQEEEQGGKSGRAKGIRKKRRLGSNTHSAHHYLNYGNDYKTNK